MQNGNNKNERENKQLSDIRPDVFIVCGNFCIDDNGNKMFKCNAINDKYFIFIENFTQLNASGSM